MIGAIDIRFIARDGAPGHVVRLSPGPTATIVVSCQECSFKTVMDYERLNQLGMPGAVEQWKTEHAVCEDDTP